MSSFIRFLVRFRFPVLALILGMTGFIAYNVFQAPMASSLGELLFGDSPKFERYLEWSERFGGDSTVLVGYQDPEPLSIDSIQRLRAMIEEIDAHPNSAGIVSLLDTLYITSTDDGVQIIRYADAIEDGRISTEQALQEIQADASMSSFLGKDNAHAAVVIEIVHEDDPDLEIAAERLPEVVQSLEDIVAKHSGSAVHSAGIPVITAAMTVESYRNVNQVTPFTILGLLLAGIWAFRRLWPVLVALAIVGLSALWSVGFSLLLDDSLNIMVTIVPAVIMVVGFADVIHLCSAYIQELRKGNPKHESIVAAASEVGYACLITSITTFIGFISLAFVPNPLFRNLGIVLAFGVSTALILAILICPIVFALLPEKWAQPKDKTSGFSGWLENAVEWILDASLWLSRAHARKVVAVWTVLFAVCIYGISGMVIDANLNARMDHDHKVNIDERFFNEVFQGTYLIDMYIENTEGDLLDPDTFAAIDQLQRETFEREDVDVASSIVNLVQKMHAAVAGTAATGTPDSRELISQYMFLFELSEPGALDPFIDSDRSTIKMNLQIPSGNIATASRIVEETVARGNELLPEGTTIEGTGIQYLMGDWVDEIMQGQKQGLLFAFISIALMMMIGTRSARVGLWSMIPNSIPLLALGGYCAWAWPYVDSDVMVVAVIAIGIGVDDTVHFLMRMRSLVNKGMELDDAIKDTFHFAGQGIVLTTLILVIGFAPVSMSNYFTVKIMGTLLPATLVVAFAADLILLPALMHLGIGRFKAHR